MSEKGKGLNLVWYLLILLTVFLWGMSFLWSDRVLDRQVPVFTFIFTRMIIAAAALSLFSLTERMRASDRIAWRLSDDELLDLKLHWAMQTICDGEKVIEQLMPNIKK